MNIETDISPEAVERLAKDHDTVGNDPARYVMDQPHHWKTAKVLRKLSARVEELEAANKRLNEQMDAIEEMGTESLNALPDCLMRLAPALVENDELKGKLAKAVDFTRGVIGHAGNSGDDYLAEQARTTLEELKEPNK